MRSAKILSVLFFAALGSYVFMAMGWNPMAGAALFNVVNFLPSFATSGMLGTGLVETIDQELKAKREARGQLLEDMDAMNEIATTEKRSFKEDEQEKWDGFLEKRSKLDQEIETLEQRKKLADDKAKRSYKRDNKQKENQELSRFSFARAIRAGIEGKTPDGLEGEMHQEFQNEARAAGIEAGNGIGVSKRVLEARAMSVTGGTDGNQGGVTVPEDQGSFIELLRESNFLNEIGVQMLTGLSANMGFPVQDTAAAASWEGETDEVSETNPTMSKKLFQPKRLAATLSHSKQLFYQSSLSVEQFIRQELADAINEKLQETAISGAGAGNVPEGILSNGDITIVPGDTNGKAADWALLVALETALSNAKALRGELRYLTNGKVRGALKTTTLDAGSGRFVWERGEKELNGYPAHVSSFVPANLTKGTGTDLSAIILGNWKDMILGQWGGLEIITDPYTSAKSGLVNVTVNSYWDMLIRRAKSFAAAIDVIA
jgi:HK97 family phage major capsid protein